MKIVNIENTSTRLRDYEWPGNIRELTKMLERLHIKFPENQSGKDILIISIELLNINHPSIPPTIDQEYIDVDEKNLKVREKIQRDLILEALKKTKGNLTAAAKISTSQEVLFIKGSVSLECNEVF